MNTNRIESAKEFAHRAHDSIGQKRKYSGEPYWVHVDEVAAKVSASIKDSDLSEDQKEDCIIAAYLHDVIEDVDTPEFCYQSILSAFGLPVAHLVIQLTDVFTKEAWPHLNRSSRKRLEAERLGGISRLAKIIKLADIESNSSDIAQRDPVFAKTYLAEKDYLLPLLRD